MNAVLQQITVASSTPSAKPESDDPIVIVGNGPVGMRAAADVMQRAGDRPVVVYGEETHLPYNRVRLSSWLAGDISWDELAQPVRRPFGAQIEERIGYRIVSIDRSSRTVTDNTGAVQHYGKLILATGSRAFVPPIPGIDTAGVYTLRNMDDATQLMARRMRSHHCVVVGGGLLGLETARGMQPNNTRVTVVEHADRLMSRQLDLPASSVLQECVSRLGFQVMLGDGIAEVQGSPRVTGVKLHSGVLIECDTVVVAAGIRPVIDLAREAGLSFGRGITVDDHMNTNDPDIYAIGECAEHREHIYGLVAPGYEQAATVATHIAGEPGAYSGSITASRLKVVGTTVFSVGPVGDTAHPLEGTSHVFRDELEGIYRKLLVRRHRLIGAIGIGEWPETVRLQTHIAQGLRISPWQLYRFRRNGMVWPEADGEDVTAWSAATTVCQCNGVTRGQLSEAISLGALSIDDLGKATCAGTTCGSCQPLLGTMLGGSVSATAAGYWKTLAALGALAVVCLVLMISADAVPYATTVGETRFLGIQWPWSVDTLWRDGFVKQVSGFTILGTAVVASLISLRKRTAWIDRLGAYIGWRLVHVVLGVVAVAGLLVHTGMRLGHGLNLWLMTCFLGLLVIGGVASIAIGLEHRMSPGVAQSLRRQAVLWHIFLIWPLPMLLGWHVFKSYWY